MSACPVSGNATAAAPPGECPVAPHAASSAPAPAPAPAEEVTIESMMGNAPPNTRPALGRDTLAFAAQMFDLARAGDTKLLSYVAAGLPVDLTNQRGDTLLMLAAYHGHVELVRGLLHPPASSRGGGPRRGADPNRLNGKGQSILAGAIFKRETEVARLLVEAGADPLAGTPSAEATAEIFSAQDTYASMFASAPGRGKGATPAPAEV